MDKSIKIFSIFRDENCITFRGEVEYSQKTESFVFGIQITDNNRFSHDPKFVLSKEDAKRLIQDLEIFIGGT